MYTYVCSNFLRLVVLYIVPLDYTMQKTEYVENWVLCLKSIRSWWPVC